MTDRGSVGGSTGDTPGTGGSLPCSAIPAPQGAFAATDTRSAPSRKANRRMAPTRRVAAQRAAFKPPHLDTLAQLHGGAPPVGLTLAKRARRHWLSYAVATALAEYGKSVSSPLERGYRNAIYCNGTLRQDAGKIVGKYCGNRWCLVCAAIRTARAWTAYKPTLDSWREAQFVTVTIRNIATDDLSLAMDEMLRAFTWVKRTMRERDGIKLVGIRKLECTHNGDRDDFHPHFHCVFETRQMARLFVAYWLDYFTDRADRKGQNITPAGKGTVAELFKYFTKLVTKSQFIAPAALDTIFKAMKGRRVFQPFGFTRARVDDDESEIILNRGTSAPTRRDETIEWDWVQSLNDWVDFSTGDCLTGYEPSKRFRAFVESIVPAGGVSVILGRPTPSKPINLDSR